MSETFQAAGGLGAMACAIALVKGPRQPPAMDPLASIVNNAADSVATSLVRDRLDSAEAKRSRLFASIPTHPGGGRAIADIGRSSKSPYVSGPRVPA